MHSNFAGTNNSKLHLDYHWTTFRFQFPAHWHYPLKCRPNSGVLYIKPKINKQEKPYKSLKSGAKTYKHHKQSHPKPVLPAGEHYNLSRNRCNCFFSERLLDWIHFGKRILMTWSEYLCNSTQKNMWELLVTSSLSFLFFLIGNFKILLCFIVVSFWSP